MRFTVFFKETNKAFPVAFKSLQTATAKPGADYYEGEYKVTPKATEQVLPTSGKILSADVIVSAIPKEYGLVSYDQDRTITVS